MSTMEERAGVGRRIAEARRESGLTQAELAAKIGVTPGILDRYENGKSDAAAVLEKIAELTEHPLSWFTGEDHLLPERGAAHFPSEVGERIAQSRARRGLTRRELAEEVGVSPSKIERLETGAESAEGDLVDRIADAVGEPAAWLETADPSARPEHDGGTSDVTNGPSPDEGDATGTPRWAGAETAPAPPRPPLRIPHEDLPRKTIGYHPKATAELFDQVAETYQQLWKEHARLEERLISLQAELEVEEREHEAASEQARELGEQLYLSTANEKALAAQLEQARRQYEELRRSQSQLPERVSELETQLQSAEARAAESTARLAESEKELQRFREQERTLVDAVVWARQAAAELSEKAEREAERLVQEAERRAVEREREGEKLVQDAERRAAVAEHEAEKLVEEAERRAAERVSEAERRAAELVSEAGREVERLAGERSRLEALTNEVQEDLSGFLLGTLARLKERIQTSSGSGEPAPGDGEPNPPAGSSVRPDE